MSTVLVLQHVPFEGLGTIGDALAAAEVRVQYIHAAEGQAVPESTALVEGLIVMGGPMAVYEQHLYPFLTEETRLIKDALDRQKPVLGICLGSQLLADALGASVHEGKRKEIGWSRVSMSENAIDDKLVAGIDPSFVAYHWHGDVFDLPAGAVSLASSDATEHQAFRYGANAYGFVFHLEATRDIIHAMVRAGQEELREIDANEDRILAETGEHLPCLQQIGGVVWKRWAQLL